LCIDDNGRACRFQRSSDRSEPTTFRTVMPADQMLALLAVLPTEVGDRDTTVEIHKG
jgi:hypothetical protein